jgi:hypothetical protein
VLARIPLFCWLLNVALMTTVDHERAIPMTNVDTRIRASRTPVRNMLAGGAAAAILALAAPAVSFLPSLTTDIHGSGAAVTYPHGFTVMLIVTVAVTVVACALGALLARRAGLAAIPAGLALWVLIGFALVAAGFALGHHAHLIDWGIALLAATVAGAAVGLPISARR